LRIGDFPEINSSNPNHLYENSLEEEAHGEDDEDMHADLVAIKQGCTNIDVTSTADDHVVNIEVQSQSRAVSSNQGSRNDTILPGGTMATKQGIKCQEMHIKSDVNIDVLERDSDPIITGNSNPASKVDVNDQRAQSKASSVRDKMEQKASLHNTMKSPMKQGIDL